jgi:hypothetical protein
MDERNGVELCQCAFRGVLRAMARHVRNFVRHHSQFRLGIGAHDQPAIDIKNPPGSANAFTTSESMTLIVKGTWASELRTRFCPTRSTYSVTTGPPGHRSALTTALLLGPGSSPTPSRAPANRVDSLTDSAVANGVDVLFRTGLDAFEFSEKESHPLRHLSRLTTRM